MHTVLKLLQILKAYMMAVTFGSKVIFDMTYMDLYLQFPTGVQYIRNACKATTGHLKINDLWAKVKFDITIGFFLYIYKGFPISGHT